MEYCEQGDLAAVIRKYKVRDPFAGSVLCQVLTKRLVFSGLEDAWKRVASGLSSSS